MLSSRLTSAGYRDAIVKKNVLSLKISTITLLFSVLLNGIMAFSAFYERSFDSYTHMFFADHYRKAWFDFWEPRWYGGFSVTTYPPLASQCLALLSYLFGLEKAYQLFTFVLMVIFPLVIYHFSTIFVCKKSARYSSLISVFLPSVLMTVYVFGQIPTLLGLELSLASFYFLQKYLSNRDRKHFLLAVSTLVASVSSHHFTAVFFLPFLTLVIMLTNVIRKGLGVLKRIFLSLFVSSLISVLILWPFWDFLLSENMQKPIFHASRSNIFTNVEAFCWFFLFMYGPMILLIPLSILSSRLKKDILPLLSVAMLFLILGLGGTTPVPRYLFGTIWEWLTYDRFTLWSHVMFLPLVGQYIGEVCRRRKDLFIITVFSLSMVAALICNISISYYETYLPQKVDISPIIDFLSKDGNWRWRYITLGFGSANLARLSIYTNASTIDGFYVTARRDPILRGSGIETLDGAKYWENGTYVLNLILQRAASYKLKWVFCNDPYYYDILINNGFKLVFSQENTKDGRLKGVTIWAKDGIPRLEIDEIMPEQRTTIFNYLWGTGPVVSLMLTLTMLLRMTTARAHSPKRHLIKST